MAAPTFPLELREKRDEKGPCEGGERPNPATPRPSIVASPASNPLPPRQPALHHTLHASSHPLCHPRHIHTLPHLS
ncbi:hypothetical protein K505DRAFT_326285 [Melanomma pulvis-pyrius CBS 109.77]|uniref:Uncharacterized protein n=1 Tax=Melanomma pulvis-pyrius CBS 109.77 TaxID=1314802 RepID=A0A6A6X7H4_9PLEO|nr:hypothetical protein K505DRAFT_326285 [Melanomma pulvis-pyrius CBS 109.77]